MCPLGTFWRGRLLLCKMLNHKNETPILCRNQQLVAVVMPPVFAGPYTFGYLEETQCQRHSRSSRIYPTCFFSPPKQWLLKASCTADPAIPCLLGLWEVSLVPHQPKSKTGQIHMSQTWLACSRYPGVTVGCRMIFQAIQLAPPWDTAWCSSGWIVSASTLTVVTFLTVLPETCCSESTNTASKGAFALPLLGTP